MGLELPIACSLEEQDRRVRSEEWARVLERANQIAVIPGGTSIIFPATAGLASKLEALAEAEADCCPWMKLELNAQDEDTELRITSLSADGESAIRQIFRVDT